MTPEEVKHCQNAIRDAAKFAEIELSRLREIEKQFKMLFTMVQVASFERPQDHTVVYEISLANRVTSENWKQVLERAIK
jgi:hypothetical protein